MISEIKRLVFGASNRSLPASMALAGGSNVYAHPKHPAAQEHHRIRFRAAAASAEAGSPGNGGSMDYGEHNARVRSNGGNQSWKSPFRVLSPDKIQALAPERKLLLLTGKSLDRLNDGLIKLFERLARRIGFQVHHLGNVILNSGESALGFEVYNEEDEPLTQEDQAFVADLCKVLLRKHDFEGCQILYSHTITPTSFLWHLLPEMFQGLFAARNSTNLVANQGPAGASSHDAASDATQDAAGDPKRDATIAAKGKLEPNVQEGPVGARAVPKLDLSMFPGVEEPRPARLEVTDPNTSTPAVAQAAASEFVGGSNMSSNSRSNATLTAGNSSKSSSAGVLESESRQLSSASFPSMTGIDPTGQDA